MAQNTKICINGIVMVELYRNIDLVQINTPAGSDEWQIPQNVAWADKVIDKIVLCAPTSTDCVSPIDGVTHVWAASEIGDVYCDIYNADETLVMHNLHYSQLLFSNNYGLSFGHKLQTQLTRFFTTTPPGSDGCLLLYVFYSTHKTDYLEPSRRNKCITFELAADERISFGDICRRWLHAEGENVLGIWFTDPVSNPAYLTLRDHDLTYMMYNVHNELMRSQMAGISADNCQLQGFFLDSLDIDFEYSYIQNATGNNETHNIVIEY